MLELQKSRAWLGWTIGLIAAITALRIGLLALNDTDLFVDEAQYWFWGQELAFGYYSKPPLIAWVIRAFNEVFGSNAPFWVRLPAPLFHAATAMILGAIAARLYDPRTALVVALTYATLPMVALGSLLISTDTIMFPFLALALACYLPLLDRGTKRPALLALCAGAALGLAFLAKYAAAYYLGLSAVAALFSTQARPRLGDALLILAAFGIVIAPNIIWNLQNGLTTLSHTADNIGWLAGGVPSLKYGGMVEFFASQFAVFGPVLFAVLLWLGCKWRRGTTLGLLLTLSLPIIAIVCFQALMSKAYANWAAAAYLAGTLATVPWLLQRPRWLTLSFAVNGAICLALPLATVFADNLRVGDDLLLKRYLGRAALSAQLLDIATDTGATAIVAENREVLADLFHTGHDAELPIFAWPETGRAPHHYAQTHPYSGTAEAPVLVVVRDGRIPPCAAQMSTLPTITGGPGAYQGQKFALFLIPGDCWSPR